MLDLHPNHLAMVKAILAEHAKGIQAWIFGSRVNGTAKRFSDIDIALLGPEEIQLNVLGKLRHAFEESDIPFSIDLVDLRCVRPAFRKQIEAECFGPVNSTAEVQVRKTASGRN